MNYLIIKNFNPDLTEKIEVSTEDLEKFKKAKAILSQYIKMESIYDHLIEEYWSFNNKVDYWRLRTFSNPSCYVINYKIRSSLNRLAFNLLNLSKLFLDMHYHEKNKKCFAFELTNCEESRNKIIKQKDNIYEENLEYVVGCKLRNKAQHSSMPVSSFSSSVRYEPKKTVASFEIVFKYEDLRNIKIPSERINLDTSLELTNIFNGYILAISNMHFLNRSLTKQTVSDARSFMENITKIPAKALGYENYTSEIELENGETINACLDWFEVANHLMDKHHSIVDYTKIFFRSRVVE